MSLNGTPVLLIIYRSLTLIWPLWNWNHVRHKTVYLPDLNFWSGSTSRSIWLYMQQCKPMYQTHGWVCLHGLKIIFLLQLKDLFFLKYCSIVINEGISTIPNIPLQIPPSFQCAFSFSRPLPPESNTWVGSQVKCMNGSKQQSKEKVYAAASTSP